MKRQLSVLAAFALVLAACGSGTTESATGADPVIIVDGQEVESVDTPTDAGADDSAETADPAATGSTIADSATVADSAPDADAESDNDTATDLADATDEELALEFAGCLRDNGVDVNDPTVNADGTVSLASLFDGPPRISAEDEPIFEECGQILEGANFGPGSADFDPTEIQDQLVEFAGCLRDQGLDVRDPDVSGGLAAVAGGPEALFGLDLEDPQYEAEVEACANILAFLPGGGPGA